MSDAIQVRADEIRATRLSELEWEIQYHINRAAGELLAVGRCLNEAKDAELVPHGEWQEWVERNSHMSVRQAQRLMLAAREIPADSPLAHLSISKVQALLALPADEREPFAAEVNAGDLSVRELQAAIKAKEQAEAKLEQEQATSAQLQANVKRLSKQLAAKQPNTENQAEVDQLKASLADVEAELARRARAQQDTQDELLSLRAQVSRGSVFASEAAGLTPAELSAAARAFIGRAAVLPHMGGQLAVADNGTREGFREVIDTLADWCERSKEALNVVEGGFANE